MPNTIALVRTLSLEKILLLAAAAASLTFVASLIFIADDSFVHPDFFRYILPEALRSGLSIGWSDLINSLQLRSPGEFRPRFLAYLIQALDQKARLALYDFTLIPSTFSPISWVLELLVGPYYLFRAVDNMTRDRKAAIAATIVYLSTIGFLSGISMVLLQGKNLSNVVLILCIYLASKISAHTSLRPYLLYRTSGPEKYLLILVMLLGLFLDEMPLFAFFLVPVLFPRLFIPWSFNEIKWGDLFLNAMFFLIPAMVFIAIVVFVIPPITERHFGFRFDYLGNALPIGVNARSGQSLLGGPYARFSWVLVLENAMTLFGFAAVPSQISPFIKSDFGSYPGTQTANVAKWIILLGTGCLIMILAAIGKEPARQYLRSIPALLLGFFVFITLLSVRHIPIVTGFYYGAIFAVLFAVFVGLCYGALEASQSAIRTSAAGIILVLVFIGASNFSEVNRGWIVTHNETLIRNSFGSIVQLSKHRPLRRQELLDIWRSWKRGELSQYLDETPISTGAVYLVAELQALDRVRLGTNPSRHQLVNYSGY